MAQARPGRRPRPPGGDDLVARMMAFDEDKDGKLTKAEVTDERLHRLFDRADADKDGVVTKEELTALATRESANNRGGPPGGGPPGGGPGGPMGRPGEILSPMLQERLELTSDQKTDVRPSKGGGRQAGIDSQRRPEGAAQNHAGARSGHVRSSWRRPWPRPRRRWPSPAARSRSAALMAGPEPWASGCFSFRRSSAILGAWKRDVIVVENGDNPKVSAQPDLTWRGAPAEREHSYSWHC